MRELNDIMDLGKLGNHKQDYFNPDVFKQKGHIPDVDYVLSIVDEAIACGIMTRTDFRTLAKRFSHLPARLYVPFFERFVKTKLKARVDELYWKESNEDANADTEGNRKLQKILNATNKKKPIR